MEDSKKIFTEVIRRQMAILGPDITMAKVKNVPGIQVNETGEVTSIQGDSQVLLSQLIDQFVELSGLIVKKTMESILMSHPNGMEIIGRQLGTPIQAQAQPASSAQAPVMQAPSAPPPTAPVNQDIPQQQSSPDMMSANRDIEELNKILNNINKSQ